MADTPDDPIDERLDLVAGTLRFLAGGWIGDGDDVRWMRQVADDIDARESTYGSLFSAVCPLCAEVTCDDGCPVALAFGNTTRAQEDTDG